MEIVKLKKYANRKLYIPKKGYVTLDKVAKIIQEGKSIQVSEQDTGKDITNLVLKEVLTKVNITNDTLQGLIRG